MNKQRLTHTSALTLGVIALMSGQLAWADPQFAAQMVQRGPDSKTTAGKIVVGQDKMRTEASHQGQSLIRITDAKRGIEWILFPDRKSYMERSTLGPDGKPLAKPSAQDPCAGMPGMTCKAKGEETIAGRAALVWDVTLSQQGQSMTITQWIDKERGPAFTLRQTMADGGKVERSFIGQEQVAGRKTEKWEIKMSAPDGKTMATTEWYDPELAMAIKQEYPGGIVSELTDIRVGPQPDELFAIPAGYTRMEMPQGGPPMPTPKP